MKKQLGSISACGFVPYPLGKVPSQRYRFEQWAPFLNNEGIALTVIPFADEALLDILHKPGRQLAKAASLATAFVRAAGKLRSIRQFDVVLVHRAICIAGPAFLERIAVLFDRPIIFDFDDAIYRLHTSDANRWFGWLKFPGKTATICRLSAHVTVGNAFLANYARQYNPNVTLIPSSIDTNQYQASSRNAVGRKLVVGWTGSSTSQTHLEMFGPVLQKLVACRNVDIRVISDRQPNLPGVPLSWRSWSSQTEVEDVGQIDIGIMPMPDDPWARGKCAFKALQYMAMGIPAVCSPVGTNCEVIQHGQNGLLAATEADWLTHLVSLIDNSELRNRLGMAGRETVEQKYSMHTSAALFAQVIRKVAQK